MKSFNDFMDKKDRKTKRQLNILKTIFSKGGFQVADHLQEKEPYVFVRKIQDNQLSFDGVRIYAIGDGLAYRVQKEEKTHPYGKAYMLDISGMFDDMISDNFSADKAGKEIIRYVPDELRKFFEDSQQAEKDLQSNQDGSMDRPVIKSTGTDYSNQMQSSGTQYGGAAG
tara:strand:- start:5680 stop:6186 length:507 start_codon:yes stop_codon:yes gene_type:complete